MGHDLLHDPTSTDVPSPAGEPRPNEGRALLCFGLGLFTAWGSLFYIFGALLLVWETETLLSKSQLSLGLTSAVITSALIAPFAGSIIDAGRGRLLLGGGALVGAVGLVSLSQSISHISFVLSWIAIGVAQGSCLNEPTFTFIARVLRQRARRAITVVALIGGLSTVLAYPVANWLADLYGWRVSVLAFALMTACVTAPLMYLGGAILEPASCNLNRREGKRASRKALRDARVRPMFWYLLFTFSLLAFAEGMVLSHSVPALVELGQSENVALFSVALIGPFQAIARFGLLWNGLHSGAITVVIVSVALMALGIGAILASEEGAGIGVLFAALFGLGYGLTSVLKPVLVSECLGYASIGTILGALAIPYYLALAAAPYMGSILWIEGGYSLVIGVTSAVVCACMLGFMLLGAECRKNRSRSD